MKTIRLLPLAIIAVLIVVLSSCGSSHEYRSYPARSSNFSLIVTPPQGVYVNRYYDGRYYYRSPEGYTYWRGGDNRYYMDRSDLRRGHYDKKEYEEWKRHYNKHHRYDR
ncbi:MAG TPA: hypothetical protein VGC95_13150 [Chitinophagaceae bacterium]